MEMWFDYWYNILLNCNIKDGKIILLDSDVVNN